MFITLPLHRPPHRIFQRWYEKAVTVRESGAVLRLRLNFPLFPPN